MEKRFELGDRPIFDLDSDTLRVNASLRFEVFVKNQSAVTLQADSYFNLNISIDNNNITANILDCSVYDLEISNTKLDLDNSGILGLLNLGIVTVVPYLENNIFQKGVQIPELQAFPSLEYDISIGNGTLVLAVNF